MRVGLWLDGTTDPSAAAAVTLKVTEHRLPDAVLSMTADLGLVSEVLLDLLPFLECLPDHTMDSELRVLLPDCVTGQVIGTGGQRIRDLGRANRTRLFFFKVSSHHSIGSSVLPSFNLLEFKIH